MKLHDANRMLFASSSGTVLQSSTRTHLRMHTPKSLLSFEYTRCVYTCAMCLNVVTHPSIHPSIRPSVHSIDVTHRLEPVCVRTILFSMVCCTELNWTELRCAMPCAVCRAVLSYVLVREKDPKSYTIRNKCVYQWFSVRCTSIRCRTVYYFVCNVFVVSLSLVEIENRLSFIIIYYLFIHIFFTAFGY